MENRNYSKLGDWDVLYQIQSEKVLILRNGDLSLTRFKKFGEKIKPWIDAGIVCREKATDPENPPEIELHYLLTKIGEDFLSDYKRYGFY